MNAALTSVPVTRARLDVRLGVALGLVYTLWGSTYLAMRFAVAVLPPWGMAAARFLVAGFLALGIAYLRKETLPSKRDWLIAIPSGCLLFVVGNGLIAVAEQSVPSAVAAVAAASSPLFVAAIGAMRGERPSKAEAAGMGLGVIGVVILTGSSAILGAGLRGLILLAAPVGWALGSVLVRATGPRASGLAAAAPQMITGGVAMSFISLGTHERLPAHVPLGAIAAWAYLVLAGSLVGFTAYAWLLRHARPAISMSYAYVNPLVAVVLGAALGGEQLGRSALLAAAFIAGGVMISVVNRRTRPAAAPAPANRGD